MARENDKMADAKKAKNDALQNPQPGQGQSVIRS